MSSTVTNVIHTRSRSTPKDHDLPELNEILDQVKAKNKADRKAKGTGQKPLVVKEQVEDQGIHKLH